MDIPDAPAITEVTTRIPGRIDAAMCFLNYTHAVEAGCGAMEVPNARDLTKKESAARDAALSLLTQYFMGEVDCGGCPVVGRGGDDDLGERVEVGA